MLGGADGGSSTLSGTDQLPFAHIAAIVAHPHTESVGAHVPFSRAAMYCSLQIVCRVVAHMLLEMASEHFRYMEALYLHGVRSHYPPNRKHALYVMHSVTVYTLPLQTQFM